MTDRVAPHDAIGVEHRVQVACGADRVVGIDEADGCWAVWEHGF